MAKITTLTTDKNQYSLKYGVNAFIDFETMMGKPITALGENIGFKELRALLFVGLKWNDKNFTEEDAGEAFDDLLEHFGMEEASAKLVEAMTSALGQSALPSE